MQPTERIEVRKIYVGSAALFGVYAGIILGLLAALFVLIAGLVMPGGIDLGFYQIYTIQGLFAAAGVVFLAKFIAVFVFVFLGALIYNLVARMGGIIDVGLAEYEETPKEVTKEKEKMQRKAAAPAYSAPAQQRAPEQKAQLPAKPSKPEKEEEELTAAREMIRKMSMG